ncbi:DUF3108 domain-containing protein [Paraferrimonas haliotis]|uniref:DUF3108 domain-containing protein n=1 Tax=Paraferrimonas haliotis TaxID=2013866 RepID=A0AA37TUL4_9GAMM|nr:DUF3108 domain-containing protein [Paraferrimonas haliotis]GLS84496.1 hypothetical protein GCM10007894_24730 [Paraferrimonas haliotis]
MKHWLVSLAAVASMATNANPLDPFTAEYKVYYGNIELGGARYQLEKTSSEQFQYKFDSSLSFLVLSDKRKMSSEFSRDQQQLQPIRFMHDRKGTGSDFNEQTAFLKGAQLIHSRYKGEKAKFDYDRPIFDPLMVQLQLRLDLYNSEAKGHEDGEYHYEMVKDNEIEEYGFKDAGTETITVNDISYDTIKLEVIRNSKKRKTVVWFAPELDYLPVQLAHFEKDSKQLNIRLASYQPSVVANQTDVATLDNPIP